MKHFYRALLFGLSAQVFSPAAHAAWFSNWRFWQSFSCRDAVEVETTLFPAGTRILVRTGHLQRLRLREGRQMLDAHAPQFLVELVEPLQIKGLRIPPTQVRAWDQHGFIHLLYLTAFVANLNEVPKAFGTSSPPNEIVPYDFPVAAKRFL